MPMLVVSTCGTSVLTHGLRLDELALRTRTANSQRDELEADEAHALGELIERQTAALAQADIAEARRRSAEINGLLALYGGSLAGSGGDHQILLCSDTWQGHASAEAVEAWLQQHGCSVELHRCQELNTKRYEEFRLALGELARWATSTISSYRDQGWEVIFNLTGGFKSLQGFVQALGMFLADRCVYLFEGTDSDLMTVPRLPLRLDLEQVVAEQLLVFRRLAAGMACPAAECKDIPEVLLFQTGGECLLSEWGELAWAQAKREIYANQELLPPMVERLRYADGLAMTFQQLAADRRVIVHQRLDDLACYVTSKGRHNPNRLGVQKLRQAVDGSTHEADAWSDGDARRLYLHWEDDTLVVDRLGPGLH